MATDSEIIRDTFTLLKSDSALILQIKKKCLMKGVETSKSELVRAGVALLAKLPEKKLIELLSTLPKAKVGRRKES